jgi:hypothetical protein
MSLLQFEANCDETMRKLKHFGSSLRASSAFFSTRRRQKELDVTELTKIWRIQRSVRLWLTVETKEIEEKTKILRGAWKGADIGPRGSSAAA